jgi:hypothetical protein
MIMDVGIAAMEGEQAVVADGNDAYLYRTVMAFQLHPCVDEDRRIPKFLGSFRAEECAIEEGRLVARYLQSTCRNHGVFHEFGLSLNNYRGYHVSQSTISRPTFEVPVTMINGATELRLGSMFTNPNIGINEADNFFPGIGQSLRGTTNNQTRQFICEGAKIRYKLRYRVPINQLAGYCTIVEDGLAEYHGCFAHGVSVGHHNAAPIDGVICEPVVIGNCQYSYSPVIGEMDWQFHCFQFVASALPKLLAGYEDRPLWRVCRDIYNEFENFESDEDPLLLELLVQFQIVCSSCHYVCCAKTAQYSQVLRSAVPFFENLACELEITGVLHDFEAVEQVEPYPPS